MSVVLHLDTAAWQAHIDELSAATPGLVPVAKGNGYGFGLGLLAEQAQRIGATALAVGTQPEVAAVRAGGFTGDVVVLTPWTPFDGEAHLRDERVITTIGRIDDLVAARAINPSVRVILEVQTSMRRHGLLVDDLQRAVEALGEARFEGWTVHLPMAADDALGEARALAAAALLARRAPVWFSHLSADQYATIHAELGVETHLRVGTRLWLGRPSTRRTTARVLDVHPVARGERIGYWQRRMPADGWVVVVSGGTANGIALEAPTAASNLRQRVLSVATGSMEAVGLALSPFTIGGRKRFFVEPPHMQSSLVFVPGACPVAIGDEVPVELRLTTATVDEVRG